MIRLTYKNFRGEFLPAFQKLSNLPGLPQNVAYNIAKISAKLKPIADQAQADYMALIHKYAKKTEQGEIAPVNGPGTFLIDPTNKEAWERDIIAFEKKEVMIDRMQIKVSDLQGVEKHLTPNDYLALEPLIYEMGLVEEDGPVSKLAALPSQPKHGA